MQTLLDRAGLRFAAEWAELNPPYRAVLRDAARDGKLLAQTLLVLLRYDWETAAWVTLLRVLAVSMLVGQCLAPGFILSLSGALASLLLLFLATPWVRSVSTWFGPVTLSVLAAIAHTMAQLLVVRLWLVPSPGVWVLAPVFLGAALFFGTLNGLIVAWLTQPADSDKKLIAKPLS